MRKVPSFIHLYQQRATVIEWVWLGALGILVSLVELVGIARTLRSTMGYVFEPLLSKVAYSVTVVEAPYYTLSKAHRAARRVQDLELRYNEALAEISALDGVEAENKALKGLLENTDRTLIETIITSPIVSYAQPSIALGTADGINSGAGVMVNRTLVGVVGQTTASTSEIDLLIQDDRHPIVVVTEVGTEGVVVGNGKRLVMTEIPRDAELVKGQRIVTAGQPGIPPNIFVGQVGQLETTVEAPVVSVTVDQKVSFYQSAVVEITL